MNPKESAFLIIAIAVAIYASHLNHEIKVKDDLIKKCGSQIDSFNIQIYSTNIYVEDVLKTDESFNSMRYNIENFPKPSIEENLCSN